MNMKKLFVQYYLKEITDLVEKTLNEVDNINTSSDSMKHNEVVISKILDLVKTLRV